MSHWRLIKEGPGNPDWNMAVDEAIAESCRLGLAPPTLRFYEWKEAALTIGYFQKIERDIDQEVCRTEKVAVIRRITGGRAVLHGNDLTYSVASGVDVPELPDTIRGTFLAISRGLIEGLLQLGLQAESVRSPALEAGRSPVCFMSASWYEIICNGRKIIGSAQRRWKDGMLQQGSLLFDFDPVAYYKLFRFPEQAVRERMIAESRDRISGLNSLLLTRVNPKTVSDQIARGFEKAVGIQFEPAGLTEFELERAHELTRIKYSNPDWNQNK